MNDAILSAAFIAGRRARLAGLPASSAPDQLGDAEAIEWCRGYDSTPVVIKRTKEWWEDRPEFDSGKYARGRTA